MAMDEQDVADVRDTFKQIDFAATEAVKAVKDGGTGTAFSALREIQPRSQRAHGRLDETDVEEDR